MHEGLEKTDAYNTWTGAQRPSFLGSAGAMAGMLIKGALLQLLTLGLYRFWYMTNIRRYLWGNTRIDDERLEYTGTGKELFIGFLVALAVLVPAYVVVWMLFLVTGALGFILGLAFFIAAGFLGQYALYRARRYRLTRTVWRGLRCHQTGSAWTYAWRASLWNLAIVLTLGVAYPFAKANLERYSVGNTWYGDRQAQFTGTGAGLFKRTVGYWIWIAVPALILFLWLALKGFIEPDRDGDDQLRWLINAVTGALIWCAIAAMLLLPWFRAAMFRWWVDGVGFGEARAHSDLSTRSLYGVFILYGLALAGFAVPLFVMLGAVAAMTETEPIAAVGAVLLYVIMILGFGVIYQLMISRKLWALKWRSVSILNVESLRSVGARGEEASAFGEGLIDALNTGSI
jgi:uncharacterized membrane protein YjgN (DUF898 family)